MCDVIDPDHSQRYSIDLKQSSFDHLPDRIFYLLFQIVRTIQTILTFFFGRNDPVDSNKKIDTSEVLEQDEQDEQDDKDEEPVCAPPILSI